MDDYLNNDKFCEDLTNELLSEAELAKMRRKTVQTARRRRVLSQTRWIVMLALPVLSLWLVLKPQVPVVAPENVKKPAASFTLVRTEPFANVIPSEPLPRKQELFASIEPVRVLNSPATPTYREISDEELLRLFQGQAVALLRLPDGGMELRFLDEAAGQPQP